MLKRYNFLKFAVYIFYAIAEDKMDWKNLRRPLSNRGKIRAKEEDKGPLKIEI